MTLPQVYSAPAYCHEHKAEIDLDIEQRRRLAEEMKEKRVGSRHPSTQNLSATLPTRT